MHLGNGAITPECALITYSAAAAGLGLAVFAARREARQPGRLALAGALGAAVFAAQMINVPLLPHASAHLVGGVLLAWVLGPGLGAITMAVVLAVQALMLGDGGLAALGANVVNMALLPALLTASARRMLPSTGSHSLGSLGLHCAAAGLCGLLAVFGGAALAVGEVALLRDGHVGAFASNMLAAHAWIGLAEGVATAALLALLSRCQSGATDLSVLFRRRLHVQPASGVREQRTRMVAGALLVAAGLLIVAALPFASSLPDGYEASAERSGWQALLTEDAGSLAGVNLAAWRLQARAVSAFESLLGDGQLLALLAATITGLATLAIAAGTQFHRRRAAHAMLPTQAKK
jgi:cobalt/nickel transport system permease protein